MATSMFSHLVRKQWTSMLMICWLELEMNFTRNTYKKALNNEKIWNETKP